MLSRQTITIWQVDFNKKHLSPTIFDGDVDVLRTNLPHNLHYGMQQICNSLFNILTSVSPILALLASVTLHLAVQSPLHASHIPKTFTAIALLILEVCVTGSVIYGELSFHYFGRCC